jgi:hypothetical protein
VKTFFGKVFDMKYHLQTRRMFLRGLGNTIFAIPFLPSLLPREAWAQAACTSPPVRFFMLGSQWSPTPQLFLGNLAANSRMSPNVNVRSLAGLTNISDFFGPEFNSVLGKMAIMRGIDYYGMEMVDTHSYTAGSSACPSGWHYNSAGDYAGVPVLNISSIDVILANSNKVYPGTIASNRRLLSFCPVANNMTLAVYDWGHAYNGSYKKGVSRPTSDGVINRSSTKEIYDSFLADFSKGTMTTTPPPPTTNNDRDVVQAIHEDYRKARDSARISKDDKLNLEYYMSIISDVVKSLGAANPAPQPSPMAAQCKVPAMDYAAESTSMGRFKNQVDIAIAAMACDLTRVANVQLNSIDNFSGQDAVQLHAYHHSLSGIRDSNFTNDPKMPGFFKTQWTNAGLKLAHVLNRMDSFKETNGTLLDNSVVYYFTQHGMAQPCSTSHADCDKSIVVAGGGNGALQMGYFIDYRHQTETYQNKYRSAGNPGLPINQLLLTFCNAFGVPASEYERPGQPGFGAYWNDGYSKPLHALNNMSAGYRDTIMNSKRNNLPFLFKKPICG